jgi:hypothetical protein
MSRNQIVEHVIVPIAILCGGCVAICVTVCVCIKIINWVLP